MSTESQAGTTPAGSENPPKAESPESQQGDGRELNETQKQEFFKLKEKAEAYNRLEKEKAASDARAAELEKLVYSRGAGQATDPQAEMISKLREAAPYDPASAAALYNMEQAAINQAENWLTGQLMSVPEVKRERVAGLVRSSNYQMRVSDALSMVTDPETKTYAERLEEANREIARLKGAKQNGSSPASTASAVSSADDTGTLKEVKRSEYIATLKAGGDNARALMQAVGSNRTKLVDD